MDHVAALPAKVLSDPLGLSSIGAIRWTHLAADSGNSYAAELLARNQGR